MWDLVNKCEKATILKHLGMCKSLVLSNCGRYVFSGGEDCLIRVFDLWLNEEVLNLKSHIGCVWSLSVNKKSTLLASGGSDKLVIVWNILDFTPMHVFEEHTGTITTLKFTYDGAFLISGSEDNSMKVWDLEKDRREITLNAHTRPDTRSHHKQVQWLHRQL
jgi:FOG: WD40 repeat